MDFNPYQAPKADLTERTDSNNGIRRYGKNVLFVPHTTDLPYRCVKCNAPSITAKPKIFYQNTYYPLIILIIGSLVLYLFKLLEQFFVIVILLALLTGIFTRKYRKLNFGLCRDCRLKRLKLMIVWNIACIACVALPLVLIGDRELAVFFMALGLPFCLYGLSKSLQLASMSKMDSLGIYLKDLDKRFLQSFDY